LAIPKVSGWLRSTVGRTSVLTGELNVPCLKTRQWTDGHFVSKTVKESAIDQPARSIQLFVLLGSINE